MRCEYRIVFKNLKVPGGPPRSQWMKTEWHRSEKRKYKTTHSKKWLPHEATSDRPPAIMRATEKVKSIILRLGKQRRCKNTVLHTKHAALGQRANRQWSGNAQKYRRQVNEASYLSLMAAEENGQMKKRQDWTPKLRPGQKRPGREEKSKKNPKRNSHSILRC